MKNPISTQLREALLNAEYNMELDPDLESVDTVSLMEEAIGLALEEFRAKKWMVKT